MKYAIIQTSNAAYGTGSSKEEALKNAREWLENSENITLDNLSDHGLEVIEITEALFAEIEDDSTVVRCELENGLYGTENEGE